jgi:hypothetical protein
MKGSSQRYQTRENNYLRIDHMERKPGLAERMAYYQNKIGPKFTALLKEMKDNSPDLFDVSEEINQIRAAHCEVEMKLFSTVLENAEKLGNQAPDALRIAASMLQNSADNVIRSIERAARIQAQTAEKMSPMAMEQTVKQICQFVYRAFDAPGIVPGDSLEVQQQKQEAHRRIQHFDRMLNDELQLPTLKSLGTSITPDQQVLAMDASIPSEPEQDLSTDE